MAPTHLDSVFSGVTIFGSRLHGSRTAIATFRPMPSKELLGSSQAEHLAERKSRHSKMLGRDNAETMKLKDLVNFSVNAC